MVGYGLSVKPDTGYTMGMQADVVEAFLADRGVSEFALLSHDMGDTVGGELLARQADGSWPVEITRRVLTNGSIYIEMAHLSAGQEILLSLPDECLPESIGADGATMKAGLSATFSEDSSVDDDELEAAWELIWRRASLMPGQCRTWRKRRNRPVSPAP